ncbi:MAG TPA: ATP-dependent DNA helicase, partial [Symbiobacteriaceae bacterium]|nr:ATP-dependent DNA helicase [Symbiobacteriaceae bacterium]
LWRKVAWDPGLPCDTCERRGHCHVMMARRHYRAAADLIICDHRLFALDLLTRQERQDAGELPLLPAYSGVIADEGHHLPETWQRAGGYFLSRSSLTETLERVEEFAHRPSVARAYQAVQRFGAAFFKEAFAAAEAGEGKRHLPVDDALMAQLAQFDKAVESLQDGLVTEEAMSEGQAWEQEIRAYQDRLDRLRSGLRLLKAPEAVRWVEGKEIWVVPQKPSALFTRGRLTEGLPLVVTSATLEPEYQARVLHLRAADSAVVGVPFDLGEQSLVYLPEAVPASADDPVAEAVALLHATRGRAIILLPSLAEVAQWKQALAALPWPVLYEGEGERGAQLDRFKAETESVLVGASFWEGVDVPGEALSCVIIPRLPFPAHDPLVRERRRQAVEAGLDPFEAVDLPEMLILLKQGLGRLIRTAADRGVLAILDRSWVNADWADFVIDALPEDAERTDDLEQVESFLNQ